MAKVPLDNFLSPLTSSGSVKSTRVLPLTLVMMCLPLTIISWVYHSPSLAGRFEDIFHAIQTAALLRVSMSLIHLYFISERRPARVLILGVDVES